MPAPLCSLRRAAPIALLAALAGASADVRGADIEQPPFGYSRATPDNCVSRLQGRIDSGAVKLTPTEEHGYLPAVLKELGVPLSSQVLVFSKTSLQRDRITPKTPRALYFNDEVYVGFCRQGDVVEVSAVDPALGAAFYTVDQAPAERPSFTRQTDNCLLCHGGSLTGGYPGHMARSVFTDRQGYPLLNLGSVRVDHTTPFADRWGGWYVTGTSGKQAHRGNQVLPERTRFAPEDNPEGVNVTDLKGLFTVGNYLTPHSDLVALMVLEHQAEMHNRLTRALYETRFALYQQAEFDRILGRKTEGLSESTAARVKSACEPLVRYMLFSEEAKLTDTVKGTSKFAEEFAARGPRDREGRSLRQFDLERRLFKYPCSYLIYSRAFEGLPQEAKDYVYRRLHEVLTGQDRSEAFAHLSTEDRKAVREVLLATKPGLPADWKQP